MWPEVIDSCCSWCISAFAASWMQNRAYSECIKQHLSCCCVGGWSSVSSCLLCKTQEIVIAAAPAALKQWVLLFLVPSDQKFGHQLVLQYCCILMNRDSLQLPRNPRKCICPLSAMVNLRWESFLSQVARPCVVVYSSSHSNGSHTTSCWEMVLSRLRKLFVPLMPCGGWNLGYANSDYLMSKQILTNFSLIFAIILNI